MKGSDRLRKLAFILALACAALAAAGAASAQTTSYQANLMPLNSQTGAAGTLMLTLDGSRATIHETAHGLASTFKGSPFPHVQHIHIRGKGTCPTMAEDANGDGVVSTQEAADVYGGIGTTLSVKGDTSPKAATNVKIAPSGSSFTYDRTIMLDSATLQQVKSGNAVIVVHGDDPTKLSAKAQAEKSGLVPSLPLAATAPALCGHLAAAQMSMVPSGGAATGGGSTAGVEDGWLILAGGASILGAALLLTVRRRPELGRS
jgi:hypothetical protein